MGEKHVRSEEELIEERKKKVKEFLLKNWHYLQYILLAIIVWIGVYIRAKPLANLIDHTTGKYISLELDSTVFLRYAKYIVENGRLFDIDPMRFYPVGADLNNIGTFTSYFVAYLYKFLHFFIPSITVEYADIIYPIISMAILTIFLFLLVRRLFDWKVGLLSALFINVIPSFLFRSLGGSSDHDILAMMFIVMAFYFFVVGWQSKNQRNILLFGMLAGLSTSLARSSAGSGNIVFLIFGSFLIVEIFLNKLEKKDFILFSSWLISATMINILVFGFTFGFINFIISIITGIAYIGFLFGLIHNLLFKTKLNKYFIRSWLPEGMISITVGIITSILFLIIFFGFDFFTGKIEQMYNLLFKIYMESRWTLTVAENHRPFVTDWIGQMGKLFVVSFIIGSILLFYEGVKSLANEKMSNLLSTISFVLIFYFYFLFGYVLQKYDSIFTLGFILGVVLLLYFMYLSVKEKHPSLILSCVYTIFIISYIFSRYSASSVFNGTSNISKFVFFGSIIGFLFVIAFLYLRTYYKDKELYSKISLIDKKYVFVFIWFFVMVFAATSAIRLLFEFTIITVIVASHFFIFVGEQAWNSENKYLKYTILVILLLILLNPFVLANGIIIQNYQSSLSQATSSGPGYNQLWQEAGRWVRENTPKDAVFAHWWDYGYWVQSGFERVTITDGGNFFGWWNYLMGRNVLTGQTFEEPLGFLNAHGATHLLIVSDEIGKYPAYSTIGSDENYDRRSFIPTFSLDAANTQETRDGQILVYSGSGFPLEENLMFQGKLLPAGSAAIGGFFISIQQIDNITSFNNPTAVIIYNNQQVNVPLMCLIVNNEKIEYPVGEERISGCLKIIPVFSGDNVNPIGAAMYLSPRVKDSLFSRLYLNDEKNEYFKLVYSTPGLPLGIIQGGLFGPIKIWEINYPDSFEISEVDKEYFLRITYPNPKLLNP